MATLLHHALRAASTTDEDIHNFQTQGFLWPATLGLHVMIIVVIALCLAIRVFTKVHIDKSFRHDDWLVIVAGGFCIVLAGLTLSVPFKGGRAWDHPGVVITEYSYYANVFGIVWNVSIITANAALLIQIDSIFVPGRRSSSWWVLMTVLTISTVYFFILMILFITQCSPREKIFDAELEGWCFDANKLYLATAAGNIIISIFIAFIPAYILWRLQMSSRKKIMIIVIFSLNCLAIIPAAVRLWETVDTSYSDLVWKNLIGGYLAILETFILVLAASYPITQHFFIWAAERTGLKTRPMTTDERILAADKGTETATAYNTQPVSKPSRTALRGNSVGQSTLRGDSVSQAAAKPGSDKSTSSTRPARSSDEAPITSIPATGTDHAHTQSIV